MVRDSRSPRDGLRTRGRVRRWRRLRSLDTCARRSRRASTERRRWPRPGSRSRSCRSGRAGARRSRPRRSLRLPASCFSPRRPRASAAATPSERRGTFDRRLFRSVSCTRHRSGFLRLGNWVATLLEREGGESADLAGFVGGLVLFLGVFSRPLGGRLIGRPGLGRARGRRRGDRAAGGRPAAPLAVAGAAILGFAAGMPFAGAFSGAQRLRPDAPAAAVGIVNLAATLVILVGTPLLGLSFSLPGGGRVGFAVRCSAVPRRDRELPRGFTRFPRLANT